MADNKTGPVDIDILLATQGTTEPISEKETATDPVEKPTDQTPPTPSNTSPENDDTQTTSDAEELEFDNNGNLVNSDGKVVFKKDDIKYDEKGNPILPDYTESVGEVINRTLEEKLGITYNGELSEVTPDAVSSYLQGALETVMETLPKTVVAGLIQEYPDLERAMNHLRVHGNLQTFNNTIVSTNYTLPADTDISDAANAMRRSVLTLDLEQTFGLDRAESEEEKSAIRARVKDMVDVLDTAGKLQSEATSAHARLTKREQDAIANADRQNREAIAAEEAAINKYWEDVKKTIKQRDLGGVVIPESDVTAFEQYLTVRGKDGLTQEQRDYENEQLATTLQIAYLRYKKFDLNELVAIAKKKDKVDTLKTQRQFVIKRNSRPGSNANPQGVIEQTDISLERLLTI